MSPHFRSPVREGEDPSLKLADNEPDEAMSEEESKAVKTFSFNVSAGQKPKSDEVLESPLAPNWQGDSREVLEPEISSVPVTRFGGPMTGLSPDTTPRSEKQVRTVVEQAQVKKKPIVAPEEKKSKHQAPRKRIDPDRSKNSPLGTQTKKTSDPQPLPVARRKKRRPHHATTVPVKHAKRGMPSTMWSLIVHGVIFLVLGLFTFALPTDTPELIFSPTPVMYEEFEEYRDVEIDLSEQLESLEDEIPAELIDPGESALGELTAGPTLADLTGDMAPGGDMLGNFGNLLGEAGNGLADVGEGLGGKALVSFFGTEGAGRRILYMLDNSGSMHSGRMEQLIAELILSVNSLEENQEFYVIFYSDVVYPLGYPKLENDFLQATQENKLWLRKWLKTVELCGGNAVDQAILAAEKIKPDIVFMLSDGDVRTTPSGRKYDLLLSSEGRKFVLHTLGLGCEEKVHRDQLLAIAEAHGGTFREVAVDPSTFQRYRRGRRPYRTRSNPGLVWGKSFSENTKWK